MVDHFIFVRKMFILMKRMIKSSKDYEQYGLDEDVETTVRDIFEETVYKIAEDEFHYDVKKVNDDYVIFHKGHQVELVYTEWYPQVEKVFYERGYVGDASIQSELIVSRACCKLHDEVYADDYMYYRDEEYL